MPTPNYGWPFPALTDPPDGASQIEALARAVDTTLKGIDTRLGRIGELLGYSTQISAPPFTTVGANVDFTAGQWPSITFTVPPSKAIQVVVSSSMINTNTATATIWTTYRLNPVSGVGQGGLSTQGTRLYASRCCVITGLTAGQCTIVPQWNISSGNSGTCQMTQGEIQVWALDS